MRTYRFGFIDDNGKHYGAIQAQNIVQAVWLIWEEHESVGPVTHLELRLQPPELNSTNQNDEAGNF